MQVSHIAILVNPIAGKGRGLQIASDVNSALKENGFQTELREFGELQEAQALEQFVAEADLIVLAGGDGSLLHLLPVLGHTQTAVYMLPTGNESLFAREFSMSSSPEKLIKAILAANVGVHNIAQVNGRLFFTMVSVGLDSEIICRIAERRTGTIRHVSYIIPTLISALKHRPAKISVGVDGVSVIEQRKGFLVVANNKQYALGIGFAPEATSTSKRLVVRFFPYESFCGFLLWGLKCLFRDASRWSAAEFFEGCEVDIAADRAIPIQADGEHIGQLPARIVGGVTCIRVLQCDDYKTKKRQQLSEY